jgi:hypothetical protein
MCQSTIFVNVVQWCTTADIKQLQEQITRLDALVSRTPALAKDHGICDMLSPKLYATPGAPVICILNCCMQAKVAAMRQQEHARVNTTAALQVSYTDVIHVV